jgi:ribosome-associated protein
MVYCAVPARKSASADSSQENGPLQSADLARQIVDVLSDRQAEDIVLLDISSVSSFADHFVIATTTSTRQADALIDALHEELGPKGVRARRKEGSPDSGWVLIDYGDVVVHLFSPSDREYYDLEGLWRSGVELVRIQ